MSKFKLQSYEINDGLLTLIVKGVTQHEQSVRNPLDNSVSNYIQDDEDDIDEGEKIQVTRTEIHTYYQPLKYVTGVIHWFTSTVRESSSGGEKNVRHSLTLQTDQRYAVADIKIWGEREELIALATEVSKAISK